MPALSTELNATWRSRHEVSAYVYISQPETVFAARVNMATASYPLTSITYDTVTVGANTDILPGMTLLLGSSAGASDYGIQRVRASATSSSIPVGRTSQGTRVGELTIVDNAYITVLNERRVWSKIPFIAKNGTQYKDELTFSASSSQPPVANAGVDYADEVDPDTSVITVDFDGTASYAVASGATITGYSWNFADGTPSTSTASTVANVTFPAGERYVSLRVTDSNGNTHTAYAWVVAVDPDTVYNWIPVEVSTHTSDRDGATFEFVVKGENLSRSTYPEGTRVICIHKEKYNGVPGSVAGVTDRQQVRFTGWLAEEVNRTEPTQYGLRRQVTFRCQDVGQRLKTLPVFSQRIQRDNSPDNWYDLANANIDRYLHYLLHWHSTALDVADFVSSNTGNTYAIPSLETDGGNFFDQVDRLAQAIGHKMTVNSAGQIKIKGDPLILPTSAQASTYSLSVQRTSTVVTTLTEADYGGIGFSSAIPPRYHWNWGEAIVATTSTKKQTAVKCYAPGSTPGQGVSSNTQGEQLVVNQTELNIREGHRYAARLNPTQANHEIELARTGWLFEPADMEWVQLTLPASVSPQRGVTYSATRFLPLQVTRRFDHFKSKVNVSMSLEREVEGALAQTYVPPKAEQQDYPVYSVPAIQFPTPVLPAVPPTTPGGTGTVALFHRDIGSTLGTITVTTDFGSVPPTWSVKATMNTLGMNGALESFVVDPFSPLYLGTGTTVNGWVASRTRLYRITDIFGTPALSQQHIFANSIGTQASNARFLQASRGIQNWVMCHSTDPGTTNFGANIAYTTDGTTWTETTITTINGTESLNNFPVLVMNERTAGVALAGAFQSAGVGRLYRTTDYGANWSLEGSPTDFGIAQGGWLHIPYGDRTFSKLYYSAQAGASTRNFRLSSVGSDLVTGWAARNERCVHSSDNYPNYIAAILVEQVAGSVNRRLYTSIDGQNFTLKQADFDSYFSLSVSSTNPNYIVFWGGETDIAVSDDFGTTIIDKVGNLSTFTVGEIINLCGG